MKRTITDEQRSKIVSLSEQGYNNYQIAIELEMKHATLVYWKKKLRDSGIYIRSQLGRPKDANFSIRVPGKLSELEKQNNEDSFDLLKERAEKEWQLKLNELSQEDKKLFFEMIMNVSTTFLEKYYAYKPN